MENQIVIIQDKKYKYYCNLCNYGAKTNSDWLKHTKSSKHERGGLKIKICPTCNHECFNHWNLKQHYIMNHSTKEDRIKQKYYDKDLLFHIYSQNDISDYDTFDKTNIMFHLNENLFDTFIGLVASDILITSASSLSYSAAILSDGEIYYKPFWHTPGNKWIIC